MHRDLLFALGGSCQLYELVCVSVGSVLGFQGSFLVHLIPIVIHDGHEYRLSTPYHN